MDQNAPREDATAGQQPADPAAGDSSAWNQTDQTAAPDPTQAGQPAGGSAPDAAAEYAAWSGDAAYQQQAAAQQAAAPQQADAAAYAAPEPQSATYSDPATAEQQAAQPQQQQAAYDQQQAAYAQQQQQAYEQQQAAYAQQQQQYEQQQAAYAQQQQGDPQQQQAYQQPQPGQQYDPQQQQAYQQPQPGQQPGYYDQSAYGQQPQQQPGQPYSYAQPAQAWPGQEQYWEEQSTGYGRSFLAVLAGFVLFTWGLVAAFGGGLVLWLGNLGELVTDLTLTADQIELVEEFDKQATAAGGVLLILGLVMVMGAIGIWAHRKWGRAFGIILGLLGTLFGIGMIISAITFEAGGVTVEGAFAGDEPSLGAGILVFGTFLLVLLAMYMGKRQFRKKGVE